MQIYVGDIITNAREDTRNNDDIPTSTNQVGILTSNFLRYANYAQQMLQGRISKVYPRIFESSKEISLVSNQATYTIDDHVYLGSKIVQVEYSHSGLSADYISLSPIDPHDVNNRPGIPSRYYRRDASITLVPPPINSIGSIRVTYERSLDRLDLRRGTITSRTISGGQLTALSIDTSSHDPTAIQSPISRYFCVNDAEGNVTMYNVPFTSYNSTSGAFTLSAHTYDTGETAAVGSYITIGKYTTTHSKLCEEAERFITEYINTRIFKREASQSATGISQELENILSEIVGSYKVADKDPKPIPIQDYTFFTTEY